MVEERAALEALRLARGLWAEGVALQLETRGTGLKKALATGAPFEGSDEAKTLLGEVSG